VVGGLRGTVQAALGETVWCELVVGSVECAIDGRVVCALDDGMVVCALDDGKVIGGLEDGLFLFVFLEVDFVDMLSTVAVSAVARDVI
jgi:hypothetical protein